MSIIIKKELNVVSWNVESLIRFRAIQVKDMLADAINISLGKFPSERSVKSDWVKEIANATNDIAIILEELQEGNINRLEYLIKNGEALVILGGDIEKQDPNTANMFVNDNGDILGMIVTKEFAY